jgi:hypothetical protein
MDELRAVHAVNRFAQTGMNGSQPHLNAKLNRNEQLAKQPLAKTELGLSAWRGKVA